jgi:hypothetical protein
MISGTVARMVAGPGLRAPRLSLGAGRTAADRSTTAFLWNVPTSEQCAHEPLDRGLSLIAVDIHASFVVQQGSPVSRCACVTAADKILSAVLLRQ